MRSPKKTEALAILRDRGVEVKTVLDVGVQHGTPELLEAYPDAHHVLFEPVEEYFKVIRQEYANYSYELANVAVSDETGTIPLKVSRKLQGMDISHSTMVFDGQAEQSETRPVSMVRLDDFMASNNAPAPYLLKIDIDGHELKALRGAEETLSKSSVVIVECVHNALPQRIDFLLKRGFRLFDLVEPAYYDGVFWQCDAIFIRAPIFRDKFEDLVGATKISGSWTVYR